MKKKVIVVYLFICFFLFTKITTHSFGQSADVLPKGVASVIVDWRHYFRIDKKFDKDGNVIDLAGDFNANLNSEVFPGLGVLENIFGLPPGSANIGSGVVSFGYQYDYLISHLQYGLTDRLTVGIRIPYCWNENKVKAFLDTSKATVGKNAALNTLAPLFILGTVPLTTHDVQRLLGPGLDINGDGKIDVRGFGYKPVKTWSDKGIGDLEVGGRYRYFKTDNWRLAFTGGVRFPTGQVRDPNSLVDIAFGDGAYALLFALNNDYIGIKNLVLNTMLRYSLVLPNNERLRIPTAVHEPITENKEKVNRNIGDVIEFEASGIYEILDGFSFSLLYHFTYKFKDHVSGKRQFNYQSLELETDITEHIGIVSLCYSAIPLFKAKIFPIPMTAAISYRNKFAGTNVTKSKYISLTLAAYF